VWGGGGVLAQRDLSCGVTNAVRQDVPLILLATLVTLPPHSPQQVDRERFFILYYIPDVRLVETEPQIVS
jgi:hypothetical protein